MADEGVGFNRREAMMVTGHFSGGEAAIRTRNTGLSFRTHIT
jgi:hypothetical protein